LVAQNDTVDDLKLIGPAHPAGIEPAVHRAQHITHRLREIPLRRDHHIHVAARREVAQLDAGGQWPTHDQAPPPAHRINSPYDEDARFSVKRSMQWVGYKVPFSEACDEALPHLITHVATAVAVNPRSLH